MELANHLILLGAVLILVSIVAGTLSSRFGAPLLLVFLVLGMLAGEDGPGGIEFDDYQATYLVGSIALAIILFDGGLRTRWRDFRSVGVPAVLLATVGVLVTAGITGVAARYLLGVGWLQGLLVGSLVASTDAAAVFLLLSARGVRLRDRLRSVLEAEAGLNDPMAVLLTITFVGLIAADTALTAETATMVVGRFALQILGGLILGLAGGIALLEIIGRLNIAAGLYPVLVAAGALLVFAGAQELGASGFMAVYIAGLVVGNRRHKATLLINRFLDGLAWLSQIAMFLILGLLVSPSSLLPIVLPALGIAAALILIARPAAVALCLPWFGYDRSEFGFVSWVGLRGAVPIFLGTIPVLAGLEGGGTYFAVVYIVVMVSLIAQGWSIGTIGDWLGVLLPPRPPQPPRVEINLPSETGRDMTAYTVQPQSLALRRPLRRLPLPEDVHLVSIIRDGILHQPAAIEHLSLGDDLLLIAPSDRLELLDRLFGERQASRLEADTKLLGEFPFDGETPVGEIADAYGLRVPANQRDLPIGRFMSRHLRRPPLPGRRLRIGRVELIVERIERGRIARVSVDLDPPSGWTWRSLDPFHIWLRSWLWGPLTSLLGGRRERSSRGLMSGSEEVGVDTQHDSD